MSNNAELRQHFAKHPWRYGVKKSTVKGPPRFNNGLIKPSIRREA